MNGKDLKGSGRDIIGVMCRHFFGGTEVNHEKTFVSIAGVSVKIRSEHHQNTSLEP
jgi:hypothetical protein